MLVQAESALDQMDWIEKITGVIASLLSSQAPERVFTLPFFLLDSGVLQILMLTVICITFYLCISVLRVAPWEVVIIDLPVRAVLLKVLTLIRQRLKNIHLKEALVPLIWNALQEICNSNDQR